MIEVCCGQKGLDIVRRNMQEFNLCANHDLEYTDLDNIAGLNRGTSR